LAARRDQSEETAIVSAFGVWVFSLTPLPASSSENNTSAAGVVLVDALDGTHVDAGAVLYVDAGFGDDGDARHKRSFPESRRR
jgi:hypothetical protein